MTSIDVDSAAHAGTNSHTLDNDQVDIVRGRGPGDVGDVAPISSGSVDYDTASVSSIDSFHSTLESLEHLEVNNLGPVSNDEG